MEEDKHLVIFKLDLNDESLYRDLHCPVMDCIYELECKYKMGISTQNRKPDLKYSVVENNIVEFECIDYKNDG